MLAGQSVVVVGGASGIGLAAAELARGVGADVLIASRDGAKAAEAAARLGAQSDTIDVTQDDSVAAFFGRCGPVDHVVLSAAQVRTGPFKSLPIEDARQTMESKFWGAWRVARAAEIRDGGSLTFVSGFLSVRPRPRSSIVAATNGALESLGRALALELAPVRVNVVSPGIVDTPIRKRMSEDDRKTLLEQEAARLPVGRVGTAEDIGRQILAFMCNRFATGSIAYIDGGALVC